jgi:histidine kinase
MNAKVPTPQSPKLVAKIWGHLGWKLMASYLVVIVVGVVTLGLTVESAAPTAFNRHLLGMQGMMGQMGTQQMEADLFANFRAAVTESLLLATVAALITAIVVSFFVSQRVVIPIRQMMQASQPAYRGRSLPRARSSEQRR